MDSGGSRQYPSVLIEISQNTASADYDFLSDTSLSNSITVQEIRFLETQIHQYGQFDVYSVRGSFNAKFLDWNEFVNAPIITGEFYMQMGTWVK